MLYGTAGCHLCDDAQLLLAESGIEFQMKDIMEAPEWQEKYSLLIPVLVDLKSKRELCWPFDSGILLEFFDELS